MTHYLLREIVTLCLIGYFVLHARGQVNYPVPLKSDKMLFYFQRSHNKNTVIYEINNQSDGHINISKPVNYYWIRFEEGGARKELSFIQRKAFGLQWELVDRNKESFVLRFNSFKKRDIYLLKMKDSTQHHAYININGEISELKRCLLNRKTIRWEFLCPLNT